MGKRDQRKTQNDITRTTDQNQANTNDGISTTGERVANLTQRSDAERATINQNYNGWTGNGGITDEEADRLRNGGGGGGSSSSGGGGGGGGTPGVPDYLQAYYQMQGKDGGFDAGRLNNINTSANKLQNTSGNFGATDTSISGLQNFARTGGIQDATRSKIYDPTLTEFSQTGGYSDTDKANLRARGNSGVSSFYSNLRDGIDRQRVAGGSNVNAGNLNAGNMRLARQQSQDQSANIRDTELGINDSVRQGRMQAASKLSDAGLGVAGLESQNTLSGYGKGGDLDLNKQGQISSDLAAGGNLDLSTQMGINQSRLAATGGISQDTLGRMSISASQAANNAALAAQNERFIIGQRQQGRFEANQGLLDTYQAQPTELMNDQNLLRGYRQDQAANNFSGINARINASQIPGIGSTINSGLNNVKSVAEIGGAVIGGITGTGGTGGLPGGTSYVPPRPR